ncbi:MAG: hypothetical protein ACTTJ3_02985 [Treponema sp.]
MELNNILNLPKSTFLNKSEYSKVVNKLQLNPIATPSIIESLKKVPDGEAPIDLIFAIRFKESRNNRIYSNNAYKSIVNQILTSDVFIPVCYGHQNKDNVNWEGRKIVGAVIGALLDEENGIVYYRIIPDASKDNEDIRRWIKNKQLNAISIWGFPEIEKNIEGQDVVTDFILRSVDFVPPLSEGQENVSLIIGENYNIVKDRIIPNPKKNKESAMSEEKFKIENIPNEDIRREVTLRMKDGRLSLKSIAGEMNSTVLTGEEVKASEEEKKLLQNQIEEVVKKAKELGFKSLDELFAFASSALKKSEEEKAEGEFKELKTKVMTEKGLLENGKPKGKLGIFIDKYAPIKQGMNREEITAVIEKMLQDKDINSFFDKEDVGSQSINLQGEMLGSEEKKLTVFEI